MRRRTFVIGGAAALAAPALAHHGWSSFNQDEPLYLDGRVKTVRWQNPHAEVTIDVAAGMKLPEGFATRAVPAQQSAIDGAGILKKTQAPTSAAGEWLVEFAPLSRMEAWGLAEPLKPGDRIEVVGYSAPRLNNGRLFRVEYLFARGQAYALRSMPVR